MTLMTATTPASLAAGVTGTTVTGTAVTSSDTINGNYVGGTLAITTVGTATNVTFVDPGHTAGGNTATQAVSALGTNTTKAFKLTAAYIDPATNLYTVNYSATTAVTYVLYPPT